MDKRVKSLIVRQEKKTERKIIKTDVLKEMYTEREISRKEESLRVRQEKKTERKII